MRHCANVRFAIVALVENIRCPRVCVSSIFINYSRKGSTELFRLASVARLLGLYSSRAKRPLTRSKWDVSSSSIICEVLSPSKFDVIYIKLNSRGDYRLEET